MRLVRLTVGGWLFDAEGAAAAAAVAIQPCRLRRTVSLVQTRLYKKTHETFLFQRLSMALQRKRGFLPPHHGNRVNCHCNHNFVCLASFSSLWLCAGGLRNKVASSIRTLAGKSTETVELSWTALSGASKPTGKQSCIQKAWDGPVSANQVTGILSGTSGDTDKARLLAASFPHIGDWLHVTTVRLTSLN